MRAFTLRILSATLAIGTGYFAHADTETSQSLSVEQAVAIALERNELVVLHRRQVEAAQGRQLQAAGFEPPSIGWEFEEANSLDPGEFGDQSLGIEQSFEWPTRRRARRDIASNDVRLNDARLERAKLRVTAQVHKAFDAALLKSEIESLLSDVAEQLGESVELARVRFQSRQGDYLDVLRTQVAHQRVRNEMSDAKTASLAATRNISLLIQSDTRIKLNGNLEVKSLPRIGQNTWEKAKNEGITLKVLSNAIALANRRAELAQQGRLPELTVGIARQRLFEAGSGSDYAWAGLLSIKLPFPGSRRYKGEVAEAVAQAMLVKDQARFLQRNFKTKLQQREDEARSLAAQLQSFSDTILPDTEDQLKAAQQSYRVRRIDALNLIDVYTTYLNTRRDYLETLVRFRAAVTDLNTFGEDLWEIEL